MSEIALQYIGKKNPFVFRNPRFKNPVPFSKTAPTWLPENDALWLLGLNPGAFVKAGERGFEEPVELEDAADIIARKKEPEKDAFDDLGPPTEMEETEAVAHFEELEVEGKDEEAEEAEAGGQDKSEAVACYKCGKEYTNTPKGRDWRDKHEADCEV